MKSTKRFKTILLSLICGFIVCPLLLGQDCPDQPYLPLTGWSVQIDPSQIALGPADPNGNRKALLLRVLTIPLGYTATDKIRACDPDGDLLDVRCQDGTLTADTGTAEYYRWSWRPTSIGVTYHWVEAQDRRPDTDDSITTRGTIVVVTIPRNRPPSLCGGQL